MTITYAPILGWPLFWLSWAMWGYLTRRRTQTQQTGDPITYRITHVALVVFAFWLLLTPLSDAIVYRWFQSTDAIALAGLGLLGFGLSFAVWARKALDDNWSGAIQQLSTQALVTIGPYRYVRHPIYSGILLAAFGTFLLKPTGATLIGFGLLVAVYSLKTLREERFLRHAFGSQYKAYSRHSWRFIPFVF